MTSSRRASIAIIGGGIIGASIAYHLAFRNVTDVVVLDKSKAGSGSTAAALGGFRHQFSSELSTKLSIESVAEIGKFKDITGYDPLVRYDGYLFIASRNESLQQLQRNRKFQTDLGIPVEFLSGKELQEMFRFYSFTDTLGGTLCMKDGHASTFAVHQGYLSRAKELGVAVLEDTPVTKIERKEGKVSGLLTPEGPIAVNQVVIAAGAYSGLVGELASVSIPIFPYPRKILVTNSFNDGIPDRIPLIIDVDSTLAVGREGKGMIMSDNRPTKPGFDLVFPSDYDESIISNAISRVPSLSKATIAYTDQGLYEMTPDANPIVSKVDELEGLYCCAGFAGHGFMHAPAIGRIMSEIMLGEKPHLDVSDFHLARFGRKVSKREDLII